MRAYLTLLAAFLITFNACAQTSIVVRSAATMHNPTNYSLVTPTSVQFFTSNGVTSFSLTLTSNANASDWRADLGIKDWTTNETAPASTLADLGVTPFASNALVTVDNAAEGRAGLGVSEWTTNANLTLSLISDMTPYSRTLNQDATAADWRADLGFYEWTTTTNAWELLGPDGMGMPYWMTNMLLEVDSAKELRGAAGLSEWTTNANSPLFNATAYSWIDSMVPAASMRLPSSGYPGLDTFTNGIQCLKFDDASDESVHFAVQINHNAVMPTNTLKPHVHWTTSEVQTAPNTNIVWGLEYTIANISAEFVASSTIYLTNGPVELNKLAHTMTSFADIPVTTMTPSMVIMCRLFRDADNGADTLTGDANLIGFDFHYQVDSLGSETP